MRVAEHLEHDPDGSNGCEGCPLHDNDYSYCTAQDRTVSSSYGEGALSDCPLREGCVIVSRTGSAPEPEVRRLRVLVE